MQSNSTEHELIRGHAVAALRKAMIDTREEATVGERVASFEEQRARDLAFTYAAALRVKLARTSRKRR